MKFMVRSGRIWQVRHKELQIKQQKIAKLTTGWVKQPASHFVVRLILQESALWGMEFKIHGWRECMKMTVRCSEFLSNSYPHAKLQNSPLKWSIDLPFLLFS